MQLSTRSSHGCSLPVLMGPYACSVTKAEAVQSSVMLPRLLEHVPGPATQPVH